MDHTKEYTELAVQIGKLMERAEDLKRDNDSLRSALAEKTAQVERLREALLRFIELYDDDIGMNSFPDSTQIEIKSITYGVIRKSREALAATAPDV